MTSIGNFGNYGNYGYGRQPFKANTQKPNEEPKMTTNKKYDDYDSALKDLPNLKDGKRVVIKNGDGKQVYRVADLANGGKGLVTKDGMLDIGSVDI